MTSGHTVAPGDRIGLLRIDRLLGVGGMSEVFLATDERLQRLVAVKFLVADSAPQAVAERRLLREARAASALNHPNIVTVYDVGERDGLTFIVMEYIDGETIDALVRRRGALEVDEALPIVRQVSDAIAAAHRAGILHRDIKGANLMRDAQGIVKVLDFGLSKRATAPGEAAASAHDSASDQTLDTLGTAALVTDATRRFPPSPTGAPSTLDGARMGTPGWAAPELIDGQLADARTDVFAIGVLLYSLLTGEMPFVASSWDGLRAAMARGPAPPSRLGGRALAAFDAPILAALSADPASRPADVPTLQATIAAARQNRRPGRSRAPWLTPRRLRLAGGLAVLLASAAFIASRAGRGPTPPEVSRERGPKVRSAPEVVVTALENLGDCAGQPRFVGDRTLVFRSDLGGSTDVYKLDLAEGVPVPLTRDTTVQADPAPGLRAGSVLVSEDESTIVEIDLQTGEKRSLPLAAYNAVAADGWIFYTSPLLRSIHRQRGTRSELLVELPDSQMAGEMTVAPDGKTVAFVRIAAPRALVGNVCAYDVGSRALRCSPLRSFYSRPAFSAGGSLYAAFADGVGRFSPSLDHYDLVAPGQPAPSGLTVSPDGTTMVGSACHRSFRLVESSGARAPEHADELDAHLPTFGPNGELAFVRSAADGDFIIVRLPGSRFASSSRRVQGHITDLGLSPDGSKVVYSVTATEAPGIYMAGVNASFDRVNRLTSNPSDRSPLWTSAGEILFTRDDDTGNPRIFRMKVDGTGVVPASGPMRQLLGGRIDGSRLLVLGGWQLYWWNPETGEELPGPPAPPRMIAISASPDGRWLAYLSGTDGEDVLRHRVGEATIEAVHSFAPGTTVDTAAIDGNGRIVLARVARTGGLWKAIRADGARW